jgi:hypothetical protein
MRRINYDYDMLDEDPWCGRRPDNDYCPFFHGKEEHEENSRTVASYMERTSLLFTNMLRMHTAYAQDTYGFNPQVRI